MTQAVKNSLIHLELGWYPTPGGRWTKNEDGWPSSENPATDLPDYFSDLNAMHEAEKVLTESQFQTYLDWLDVSCGGELELSAMLDWPVLGFGLVHATASQRAEAFGLTLNLWTTNDNE